MKMYIFVYLSRVRVCNAKVAQVWLVSALRSLSDNHVSFDSSEASSKKQKGSLFAVVCRSNFIFMLLQEFKIVIIQLESTAEQSVLVSDH